MIVYSLLITIFLSISLFVYAGEEQVYLAELSDINLVIVRSNGESYRMQHGIGCRSLWKYRLKNITIVSAGDSFGAEGARIVIPELEQSCQVQHLKFIGPWNKELPQALKDLNPPENNTPEKSQEPEEEVPFTY